VPPDDSDPVAEWDYQRIGRVVPCTKRSGTGRFEPDDKAKRAMIEGILCWPNRPAAAVADPRDKLIDAPDPARGIARQRVRARCGLDRTIRSPLPPPAVEIQEKKSLP
jgi:hypothetical protein